MGLFDRFIGKKENSLKLRAEFNKMGTILLGTSGVDFDHASPLEQAVIGTFFFGMAYAQGKLSELTPPEAHALILKTYCDVFHYSPEAAAQAAQSCIDATAPGTHDTMNAILHRGIDGHMHYINGDLRTLAENIRSVLEHFKK